jgi:hypothetical protein
MFLNIEWCELEIVIWHCIPSFFRSAESDNGLDVFMVITAITNMLAYLSNDSLNACSGI